MCHAILQSWIRCLLYAMVAIIMQCHSISDHDNILLWFIQALGLPLYTPLGVWLTSNKFKSMPTYVLSKMLFSHNFILVLQFQNAAYMHA